VFKVIKTENRHCEEHGIDWVCEFTKLGGRVLEGECPECLKERVERERIEDQRRMAEEAKQRQIAYERQCLERRVSSSLIPQKYLTRTFDNYRAETPDQLKALSACQRFAEDFYGFQRTGAGLIMTGRPGTGKTHLACAIANSLIEQGHTCVFITASKMIRKIRETYRRDSEFTEQQIIDSLRDVDLLIIDEVGVQRGTESEEHLLFEVLNERNSVFAPTIILSNLTANQIKDYIGERALDRLREGGGKLVVFDWESYRGRVAEDSDLPGAEYPVRTEPAKHSPACLSPFPMED